MVEVSKIPNSNFTMKPLLIPANSSNLSIPFRSFLLKNHNSAHTSNALFFRQSNLARFSSGNSQFSKPSRLMRSISVNSTTKLETTMHGGPAEETTNETTLSEDQWNAQVGNPNVPPLYISSPANLSLSDQAFFLLSFITCMTSVAFASLVIAAVPTLYAMGRAATSLSKLADTAREELPSTMAAIRLSGMEISDLTLELSELSQDIADGVSKSAQVVQAAEAGIQQIGTLARKQTISIIEERANLPNISLQPIVVGAAKKTSRAVGNATKTLMNLIYQGAPEDDDGNDMIEN